MAGAGVCALCKHEKRAVRLNKQLNQAVCSACYKRELAPRAACSRCGRVDWVARRTHAGAPLCQTCYKAEVLVARCGACGQLASIHQRDALGLPICDTCYKRLRARPVCVQCGRRGRVATTRNGGAVCERCYQQLERPRRRCSRCGDLAIVAWRARGRPVCPTCYDRSRPREHCSLCGKLHVRKSLDRQGHAICDGCYVTQVQPRKRCTSCRRLRPALLARAGVTLCAGCYQGRGP
jgi:hypothetical protein